MADLGTALRTTIATMRAYVQGLTPSERDAFKAGLHASHFEEALAGGEWDRAAVHARVLTKIASAPRMLEVTGQTSRWVEMPIQSTPLLSTDERRTILQGASPIPGLCAAKLLGATWPMAGAVGLLSAPIVMLVVIYLTREADR